MTTASRIQRWALAEGTKLTGNTAGQHRAGDRAQCSIQVKVLVKGCPAPALRSPLSLSVVDYLRVTSGPTAAPWPTKPPGPLLGALVVWAELLGHPSRGGWVNKLS